MTDVPVDQRLPGGRLARLRALLASVLGPFLTAAFRDPVRDGRLRLDALSRLERQLARAGLVLLGVLLGSMLLSGWWRRGDVLSLGGSHELNLLPVGAYGLTLLAFFTGFTLLFWGALDAAPTVRLLVAVGFGLTMVTLDKPPSVPTIDSWVMRHGPAIVHAGFLTAIGALLVSAALAWQPRVSRVLTAVLRVVVVLALGAFFLGLLLIHHETAGTGSFGILAFSLDTSIESLSGLSLPLLFVSAVVVVDLAFDVSTSLEPQLRRLSARWALVIFAGVVAVKLWTGLVSEWSLWVDLVQNQPLSVVRTVGSVLLLVVTVAVVTRFPPSEDFVEAKERVIYLGAFLLAAPFLLQIAGSSLAMAGVLQFDTRALQSLNNDVPYGGISRWLVLVLAAAAVATGTWLMRRSAGGYGDELGSALIVVGVWNIPASIVSAFELPVAFSYPAVDLMVTVAAIGIVLWSLVRRGRVPATLSVLLTALVVFSWLVMSQADYVSFLGGLLGLPVVVVVVFGILYSLASDSAFASASSKRLPREARPMLLVGYLLLSVVILHWLEVTHESEILESGIGFVRLGIPLAAWLVGRRIITRVD
ncbi:MAG TPA: hypothetical protein VFV89_11620 [Nocardioides sp.]|uniref:hypothetical protein n=1 Tax=Nocardioides sp. TaxID=35761 RepID=UPI002E33BE89|nr:hypothetical protein [Nocardioides sp.]HEX5088448.1 hypothetical protein [Nocardioides sp.]